MVDDAVPIVMAKNIERDNYKRRMVAIVLLGLLGCIIVGLILGLGFNFAEDCAFDDEVCCGVDFDNLAIPQNIPLLCYCNQSLDNVIAGLTNEGLNASDILLEKAIDNGLVDSNVTINLTSCSPIDQLYISAAYLEDWIGLSIEQLLKAPGRGLGNFVALAYFFIDMAGVAWIDNSLWYQSVQICQWFGAQCLFLDTFSSLNLANNKLKGQLSTILGALPTLRVLNLAGNYNITGSIPTELSRITALNTLDLSRLQLTGTIPTELGELKRLSFFNLSNNTLTGSISRELFSNEVLENLGLSNNYLQGSIPTDIAASTDLRILELGRNMLTGSLPTKISNLSRLELINLRNNEMSGTIPSSVFELTTLELINILDSGLDVEQIPASACDASPQRVIFLRCTEAMLLNETLWPCVQCSQNIKASVNSSVR